MSYSAALIGQFVAAYLVGLGVGVLLGIVNRTVRAMLNTTD